jgi:type I restriction enzyme S subunit
MEEVNLSPELRFPEFESEWFEQRLSDLLTFKNGVNAAKEDYGDGYKFINVLDIIQNDYITHDRILGSVNISEDEFKKNIVEYGDILFQRSSETREEVGQANVYLDKEVPATFGGFVIRGKKKVDYDPSYMNALLKTTRSRKEITSKSGGSTRYNVGQDTLSSVIIYTTELEEQKKIATFLTAVDQRIQLLHKKKAKLEEYKKGVMQKLFTQEIRFKDDNGNDFPDWEEKKLGEVCEITTGKLDANAMVANGKYRFYTCAKEYFKIDDYAFDFEALLISGNGANVGYIHHYEGKFNAYQRTYVLYNLSENFEYIKYFLNQNLQRRIHKEKKDGNTPYIVLGTLTELTIKLPEKKEQKKIASFLTSLDRTIDCLDFKLNKTIAFKKGLLQKLFV